MGLVEQGVQRDAVTRLSEFRSELYRCLTSRADALFDLCDGLLLTDIDVSRSYRAVNVYFLDPSQQILVPDPVFVPKSPGTSTL